MFSDKYCDIYALEETLCNILDYKIKHTDYDNIFILNKHQKKFVLEENQLVCDGCHKISVFIHDSSRGFLCPRCIYNERKKINYELKSFCESCGGKSSNMVEIGDKLLCYQDKCLMPFGIRTKNKLPDCSCQEIAIKLVEQIFPNDIIEFYIKPYIGYSVSKGSKKLIKKLWGDCSKIDILRCIPCQIKNKYKLIT